MYVCQRPALAAFLYRSRCRLQSIRVNVVDNEDIFDALQEVPQLQELYISSLYAEVSPKAITKLLGDSSTPTFCPHLQRLTIIVVNVRSAYQGSGIPQLLDSLMAMREARSSGQGGQQLSLGGGVLTGLEHAVFKLAAIITEKNLGGSGSTISRIRALKEGGMQLDVECGRSKE